MFRRDQGSLRQLVTVLCVAAVLLPAAAGAATSPEAELDEVTDELGEARSSLRRVEHQQQVQLADLEVIDARQTELQSQLRALNGRLDAAQAALDDAEHELAATTSELVAAGGRLQATRRRLEEAREAFAERARDSYMYGGSLSLSATVVDVDRFQDFGRGLKYARVVVGRDRDRVEMVHSMEGQVERGTVELAKLQRRRASRLAVAGRERDRVAGIVAEREGVAAQVAGQVEQHRLAITQLSGDRETYLAMVSQLQAESAELEAELRRRAEAQARRARQLAARRQAAAQARAEALAQARAERQARAEAQARAAARAEARAAARIQAKSQARAQAVMVAQTAAQREAAASQPAVDGDGSAGGSGSGAGSSGSGPQSGSDGTQSAPVAAPASASGMLWPAEGPVTSDFGYRTHPIFGTSRLHAGIDIGAGYGAPIAAADAGIVASAGVMSGYGNVVVIDHGGGLSTAYAHQSSMAVSAGQRVSQGEIIGYVGSTGYSTGPHLHFEVRVNGSPRDPIRFL